MADAFQAVSPAHLRDIVLGKAKPANDREAMQASSALMWKQAFETAMRPVAEEEQDPVSAPQKQSIREAQAQWMGVEAAVAFGQSLARQLEHTQARPGPTGGAAAGSVSLSSKPGGEPGR